jgi:hypothetical protein
VVAAFCWEVVNAERERWADAAGRVGEGEVEGRTRRRRSARRTGTNGSRFACSATAAAAEVSEAGASGRGHVLPGCLLLPGRKIRPRPPPRRRSSPR